MPQPKQTKGRCLAQLGGSGPLLLPTLARVWQCQPRACLLTGEGSKGFCNPAHWGQGKGSFKEDPDSQAQAELGPYQHSGDPGPLPCEFFLLSQGSDF